MSLFRITLVLTVLRVRLLIKLLVRVRILLRSQAHNTNKNILGTTRSSETLRKHYFQPSHMKSYLSIMRFVILQTHVRSCFIGLAESDSDYVCKLLKGSVASLCGCTGLSDPSLVIYMIRILFPWTDSLSFIYLGYVLLMDNFTVLRPFNSILSIAKGYRDAHEELCANKGRSYSARTPHATGFEPTTT